MTHNGGFAPFESLDGRALYYLKQPGGALFVRPTAGGEERSILPCIDGWGYAVGPRGVFHLDCPPPGTPASALRAVRHWDAATGRDLEVGRVERPARGLSASPDGRSLLYTRYEAPSNLMMIEHFK